MQMFPFMKDYVSVHQPIIYTGLKEVHLNRDDGPFYLQWINGIQGKKPSGQQWNRLLDAVVTILRYKKSTIYHAIYIKVFSDGTVSYITVSTNDEDIISWTKKIIWRTLWDEIPKNVCN